MQQQLREYLVNEFQTIGDNIIESPVNLDNIIYQFSACHGAINRVINIEFDPNLILLYSVFNYCYNSILQRITLLRQNAERQIQFPPNFHEKLGEVIKEFSKRFQDNSEFYDLLPGLTTLCYVTTGNGYYLYQTGRL